MNQGHLLTRDRLVVACCALVAVLAAVVPTALWWFASAGWGYLDTGSWRGRWITLVPAVAALTAVVLTRIRWVGVLILLTATLLGSATGVLRLLMDGLDLIDLGPVDLFLQFGWTVVLASLMIVADLVARAVPGFTASTGMFAGAAVAAVGVLLPLMWLFWVGVGVAAVGGVAGKVMAVLGFGQPAPNEPSIRKDVA